VRTGAAICRLAQSYRFEMMAPAFRFVVRVPSRYSGAKQRDLLSLMT